MRRMQKNKKGRKEDTDKKKTAGSNGVVKRQAPDIIKDAVATNGQGGGKSGKAGSPPRKVVGGKENQGDAKQTSSKSRIRERTLERDDMLGTKRGEVGQKKVSVGSNKEQDVVEGGLMRPTKAWLNHLGDQQGNPPPARSPSPRRRPSRSSAQSSKPPPGTEVESGPRRSSSLRAKAAKPDGRRASSATGGKNAQEVSNENVGEAGRAVRAKSPRKKTSKSPPPVPPKPNAGPGTEEGVVEETISAGEAIIKFETESATFAAVSGQESGANCKESAEGKSTMSETKSRKNASQVDNNQERVIEGATTENTTGAAAVNGKTSRSSRTSQGSKTRSVSVSSSRKSAKGSPSGAESSKEGAEVSKKSSVVSGGGEGGLMR